MKKNQRLPFVFAIGLALLVGIVIVANIISNEQNVESVAKRKGKSWDATIDYMQNMN